jgi:SsrA-binding protein
MRHFNPDSRDYNFIKKFEAGLVLTGADVKSLRTLTTPLKGSRVDIIGNRPYLVSANIPHYKFSQTAQDTTGQRSLLLNKSEIKKLISFRHQKYMLVPIKIYSKGNWFKLKIGVGRKFKKYEKRQKLKQRDFDRSQK